MAIFDIEKDELMRLSEVLLEEFIARLAEAEVAIQQIAQLQQRGFAPRTVGADHGYCSHKFIAGLRGQGVVPHPASMTNRHLLGVRVRSQAYQLSQKCDRRVWHFQLCIPPSQRGFDTAPPA